MELRVTNKIMDTNPIKHRLTQGEALVDRPQIVMRQNYEGLDLGPLNYEIRAVSDKETMVRRPLEKKVEGGRVILTWTVTKEFTAVSGDMALTIIGMDSTGSEIIKITSDKITIRKDPEGDWVAPPPSVVEDALNQMAVIQAATIAAKNETERLRDEAVQNIEAAAADIVAETEAIRDAAAESARRAEAAKTEAEESQTAAAQSEASAIAQAAIAAAEAAKAADAAGDAETSKNEAKRFAELAGQISNGCKGWYPNLEALEAIYPPGPDRTDGEWALLGDTDSIWVWDSDTGEWKDSRHGLGVGNVWMDGGATIILEGSFAAAEHTIEINDDLPPATNVGYNNAESGLEAVTMQEAIDEVNANMKIESAGIQAGVAGVQATADEILSTLKGQRPKRYGYRVKISEPDPSARVEYLYDAVGMTPAFMDYANGEFNMGTWGGIWFVRDNYPVMVKYDGHEDYRLNPNDYTKKLTGADSDVANAEYGGNAMTAIPCCWVKRWEEDGYRYVVFCETQYDEGYKAHAHTRADGSIEKVHYYPIYKGCIVDGKLRSLSGQYPQYNTTAQAERTAAQANGTKWDIRTWAMDELIADLLTLMAKSTDSQAAFGQGHTARTATDETSHYGHIVSGTLDKNGQFFGYNDTSHQVKVFHMEGFWAGRWDRQVGAMYIGGIYRVKMTPEGKGYNFTGEGYTPACAGTYPTVSGSGYYKTTKQTEFGCFPVAEATGSDATYECDNVWWNDGIIVVSLRGGACSDGSRCGSRCLYIYDAASKGYWSFGASLSCESPS